MSKIVARLMENVAWLDEVSSITTVFFILLFVAIVIGVFRMKRDKVEEYKNYPLNDNDPDDL
jgi:cbb3-type cytochrome oxidase subunit 3